MDIEGRTSMKMANGVAKAASSVADIEGRNIEGEENGGVIATWRAAVARQQDRKSRNIEKAAYQYGIAGNQTAQKKKRHSSGGEKISGHGDGMGNINIRWRRMTMAAKAASAAGVSEAWRR